MRGTVSRWAQRRWRLRGTAYRLRYRTAEVDRVLAATPMAFLLGSGRSGTQWLHQFLHAAPNAGVYHEPDFESDVATMDRSRRDPAYAWCYIHEFRRMRICERIRHHGLAFYGETTGTLRYHAVALREVFPYAHLLVVARDGRDVVRSVMNRSHYQPGTKGAYALEPLPGDPFWEQWAAFSRFEKVCWMWQDAYRTLLAHTGNERALHFESLLGSYEYTAEHLLTPLGLEIPREVWQRHVDTPSRNASTSWSFPHWRDWDEWHYARFVDICQPVMHELGYSI